MTHVPNVAVAAVDLVGRCGNRDVTFFGVRDRITPGLDIPFSPGRDDLQLRRECFVCELETYLIVAFTRASMRHGVRFLLYCNFDLPFCEKRPGDRCPQQIPAFVHRSGSDERPEVLSYEFVPKVLNVALGCATADRLFFQPLE